MFDITILFVSKKSSKVKWILSPWNYTNVMVHTGLDRIVSLDTKAVLCLGPAGNPAP